MANTSAPLSEVAVASMAASLLDEFNLTDLDANTPIARFMARQFGYVRDEVSQVYPWHFLTKRASLAVVGDDELPAFGWSYAYNLPSDCIRLLPLTYSGKVDGRPLEFELESRQILTNAQAPLNIRYIRREPNIAKWQPLAARVFAARLALYAAMRITGKASYAARVREEYDRVMNEAMHADSLERGNAPRYSFDGDVLSVRNLPEHFVWPSAS